jgi:hypothetical protein
LRRIKKIGTAAALVAGALLGLLGAGDAFAQAKKSATFNVTAVHSAPGMRVTITSKVWIGQTSAKAIVTHPLEGEMIYLVSGGSMYQLQPSSKKGVKGQLPPQITKQSDLFDFLVAQFAFDASGVLKTAKKIRSEKVSGYDCDVYSASQTEGPATRTITVWMPSKGTPAFPVKAIKTDRTQIHKPGADIDQTAGQEVTLSSIQLGAKIDPSIFKVPPGYNIQSGQPKSPSGSKRKK